MLVQAIRLHLQQQVGKGIGWLFALSDPQMRTAIACMHDSPGHSWTLQELASRVGMSRTVFAQRFKSRVGVTPMEYLTRWRMLLAGNRLVSSDEPISQISSSIDYETDSAFGRAFRKFWGCSPREHRRQATVDDSV
jgi:AraC-like DNA-binding protein